ncbi:putative quinol monooxygenase [Poriferisphaera sp. WC338]|uniref:putative quinol monooxygenase n=1 Tax=Poriferisphaera sp. WC338 TaxID=3425129 RepID=UPI003D81C239
MKKKKKKQVVNGFTRYVLKPDHYDDFLEQFLRVANLSRQEPGCKHFELYKSIDTPDAFIIYHMWATEKDWDTHLETDHLIAFLRFLEDVAVEIEIMEATAADLDDAS